MELDDSWHFRGVLQSHAAVVQVCTSAFTLMHFKKAYIMQRCKHANKQTGGSDDEYAKLKKNV